MSRLCLGRESDRPVRRRPGPAGAIEPSPTRSQVVRRVGDECGRAAEARLPAWGGRREDDRRVCSTPFGVGHRFAPIATTSMAPDGVTALGRYQQRMQARRALAPRVNRGERANGRRPCFRPHPQQTTLLGKGSPPVLPATRPFANAQRTLSRASDVLLARDARRTSSTGSDLHSCLGVYGSQRGRRDSLCPIAAVLAIPGRLLLLCLLLRSSWLTMTAAARSRGQSAASPGRTAPVAEAVGVAGGAPTGERHLFSRGLPQCRARPAVWLRQ